MGALWPLRPLPEADDSRVKMWRKHTGDLPPVLVWYVSAVGAYVVLDGHARLRAALAQGVAPPLIALWPARDVDGALERAARNVEDAAPFGPAATERLEARLRELATHPPIGARTRAWPMRGGAAAWRANVDRVLARHTYLDADDVHFLREGR